MNLQMIESVAALRVIGNRLKIGEGALAPIPHVGLMLTSMATRCAAEKPICVVLPETEGIAELTSVLAAIEWFGRDFS